MGRVAQDADEKIFSCYVQVETGGDNQADETDSVGYFLDDWACRTEGRGGNPLAAPAVDDEGEGEVSCLDDCHAGVECLVVVFWRPHLGDDGQEGRRSGRGDEDCC